jgi:hypothetical protein
MAEFKKLSEVDVLETASDNATVLIEEGGDIKRVPKKEVGGAGGYIATFTVADMETPVVDGWNGPVLSENYDELYDVLCAGGSAWIDVSAMMASGASTLMTAAPSLEPTNIDKYRCAISTWLISDIGLLAGISIEGSPLVTCLFPNGSHNLEPNEEK